MRTSLVAISLCLLSSPGLQLRADGLISKSSSFERAHKSVLLKGIVLLEKNVRISHPLSEITGVFSEGVFVPGGIDALKKALDGSFDQEISQESLEEIKCQILDYYRTQGYPFISIAIPEQDITEGVVTYSVTVAKVGRVSCKGNRWLKEEYVCKHVPLKCGEFLSEDMLLNDLSWINRNPFHHTNVTLTPGENEGETDIELTTQDRFPVRLFVGGDNTGTKYTGRARWFTGLNWGNAFWLSDLISYQFTTTDDVDLFVSHVFNYTSYLPWRDVLSLYGGYSRVRPKIKDFRSTGRSSQVSLRYTVPFKPCYKPVLKEWFFGFDFKRTNNNLIFLGENEIPVINDTVNIGQFATGLTLGGVWEKHELSCNFELYFSPGDLLPHQSNKDFNHLRAHAKKKYLYERLTLEDIYHLPKGCSLAGTLRLQGSNETLLPSEQFGLGGYDTVRGYDERTYNSDAGGCLNVELRTPSFNPLKKPASGLTFLLFFDYGRGWNFHTSEKSKKNDWLAGIGPGVRFALSSYLSMRFDYGFPLHHVNGTTQRDKGKVHVSVIGSF